MTFTSQDNRELLWEILHEDGYFNNIRPSLVKNIKTEFENTIIEMSSVNTNDSLINKNKNFITNFTYKLKALNSEPFSISNNLSNNDISEIYTSQAIQKNRQEQLNLEFNNKKKEMDSMLIATKPSDINFSELNSNDEPIKNIDDILKQTIEQRNIEIKTINTGYDKKAANKWIGSEKKITFKEEPENIVIETNEFTKPINLDNNSNEQILDNNSNEQILDNNNVIDLLNTILTNQTNIMKHLNIN